MQFITAASLFAAAVSGAAITPRQFDIDVPAFDVSNFNAYCLPRGACYYQFEVIRHANGENIPVKCDVSVRGDGVLPSVEDGQCTRSSRTFSVKKNDSDCSLVFSVMQPDTPSSNTTGSITIPSDQLKTDKDGLQTYTGPKEFVLEFA